MSNNQVMAIGVNSPSSHINSKQQLLVNDLASLEHKQQQPQTAAVINNYTGPDESSIPLSTIPHKVFVPSECEVSASNVALMEGQATTKTSNTLGTTTNGENSKTGSERPSPRGAYRRGRVDSTLVRAALDQRHAKEYADHQGHGRLRSIEDRSNTAVVVFQAHIFAQELLIHAAGPLSIPFIWYFQTKAAVINRQLYKLDFNNFVWATTVIINMLYYTNYPMKAISFSEVFLATCMFMARNCVIAFKYAYFSPAATHDRLTRLWTRDEVANSLILYGWRVLPPKTRELELNHAIQRTRIDISQMYLTFHGDMKGANNCSAYLSDPNLNSEGAYDCNAPEEIEYRRRLQEGEVHVKLLLRDMLADATQWNQNNYFKYVAFTLAFTHGAIPFAKRIIVGDPFFGYGGAEIFCSIGAFIVSSVNFMVNLWFVWIGIRDYNRRIFLQHQISAMLTVRYKIWQTRRAQQMPLLEYHLANNIGYWLDIRHILKDFGLQFFLRIQAYASVWAFVLFLFVCFLLFQVLYQNDTAETVAIAYAIYDVVVLLIFLIIMVFAAQNLNSIHVEHRLILTQKKNNIERILNVDQICSVTGEALPGLDPKSRKQLRSARDMLKSAIEVIEIEDTTNPVQILGISANQNLFRALLGVAASGFLAAAKLIIDKQSGK